MLKRFAACLLIVAVLIAGLAGCGQEGGEGALSQNDFTDQAGRIVHFDEIPRKIISLAPSNTEILFALNLGDRVVGVTDYCDYPAEAQTKTRIGGYWTPNLETIVSLEPDLVVAQSFHQAEIIPQLENYGIPVIVLEPLTLDEVLDGIILLGDITGKTEEASRLVETLQSRIETITNKVNGLNESDKPGVFYLTWHDPLITVGSKNIGDDLIVKAGGLNIFRALEGSPIVSLEEVVNANPDIIIAGIGMGTGEDLPLQYALEEPRLADTSARLNNRVYGVSIDFIGRPGPRMINGLEDLFALIHPEL